MTEGLVSDYQGRKWDLLAFSGAKTVGEVKLTQELFGNIDSGFICVGAQKLMQDWLIEFLTIRGSMPFDPERGTTFVQQASQGRLRTEGQVIAAFAFAATAVKEMLTRRVPESTPDDERLDSVTLLGVEIGNGSMQLSIDIRSVAGDSRKPILPISTVPANLTVR